MSKEISVLWHCHGGFEPYEKIFLRHDQETNKNKMFEAAVLKVTTYNKGRGKKS
jgi:hypothetical protein